MKHMKKLFGLLLAVVMVFAMSVSVFADDATTYTITIDNAQEGHTYQAYQIFQGTLTQTVENGVNIKKLTEIDWGTGVTDAGKISLGNAEARAKALNNSEDAANFAGAVAGYLQMPVESTRVNGEYKISNLKPGYYLVKDKENTLKDADDFYTAYIMQVVGDVQATPKGSKPTLDKQIKHNETDSWGVVGDNQIGDTVEFRTITTVPTDLKNYTTYNYQIVDTMSAGLTSNVNNVNDIKIKVNNDDAKVLDTTYYAVDVNSVDPNKFTVTINILQAIADGKMQENDTLYTYYSGVLNKDAKIYEDGSQDNTAQLIYSNNPNKPEENGKTPEKKVYDWTFKMGIKKVNENGKSLTGAKFVLSKMGTLTVHADDNGNPSDTAELIALIKNADGTYTVAPTGYTGPTTYVIEAGNTTIRGLDDAINYYLYETKAPSGYNRLGAPVRFKIDAVTNSYGTDGKNTPTVEVTVDNDSPSNNLSTNIINREGSSLPSTGGIGTTIFYVVGGILMAGAVILLITKKKMSNK